LIEEASFFDAVAFQAFQMSQSICAVTDDFA